MASERKPRHVSDTAQASNPGRLAVQLLVYCRCFPALPVQAAAGVAAAGMVAFWSTPALVGSVILLAKLVGRAGVVKEHFWFGCVNPGVVISHDPDLIAVYTDLSTGAGSWPVVKVLPHPLKRMTGGRPPIGGRLAAVALYSGVIRRRRAPWRSGAGGLPDEPAARAAVAPPRWADFLPLAVNCATGDRAGIERVFASIEEREWKALETALLQIPRPPRPDLYPVELPPELLWT